MSKSSNPKSNEKIKEPVFFSKLELIQMWLDLYPNDSNHKQLEDNALAGYVLTPHGYVKTTEHFGNNLVLR